MKTQAQFVQLLAEIAKRGALMDSVAEAAERCAVGIEYPPLFSNLLQKHSFVAFDVGGVRVHSNLRGEEDNLEELLADKFLTQALCGAGFAPFGRPATGSYDRVCFDLRNVRRPLEAPVVVMDHEAILSYNQIPKPCKLADGFLGLFALDNQKHEPGAAPNAALPHR